MSRKHVNCRHSMSSNESQGLNSKEARGLSTAVFEYRFQKSVLVII